MHNNANSVTGLNVLLCYTLLLAFITFKIIYKRCLVQVAHECMYIQHELTSVSSSLSDPLEITIQYHFPASAAQRPVSGTLVMENYQLAQMK